MKGQIKSNLLAVALTAVLTGLALPSLAGAEVKVTVLAAEYNDNQLVAAVVAYATAGEDPKDWGVALSVDGASIGGVVAEDLVFKGVRLWKIVVKGNQVDPGDQLVAEVAGGGNTGSDTAACGPGLPRLHITAICK